MFQVFPALIVWMDGSEVQAFSVVFVGNLSDYVFYLYKYYGVSFVISRLEYVSFAQ